MKRFSLIALFAFMVFFISSCGEDEPEVLNIVETAVATDDLSSLVAALQQAGLVSTLEGTGPFTVMAPTNQAFQDLLDSNTDWNTLADIDNATLTDVLLFHVLSGNIRAADLTDSYVNTSATGPNSENLSLRIQTTGGVEFNTDAMPSTTDVEATNGVVHIINKVMLPPNVVGIAINDGAFSTLVAALTRSDLTTDYVTTLTGNGPFTVFAPTNDAFQALLDSDPNWNSLDDIPVATLEAVLNYHVVNGANVQSDELTDGQTITTLGSGTFDISLTSGAQIETTSNQTVNIIATDVQGTNGVVHVVDMVLLP